MALAREAPPGAARARGGGGGRAGGRPGAAQGAELADQVAVVGVLGGQVGEERGDIPVAAQAREQRLLLVRLVAGGRALEVGDDLVDQRQLGEAGALANDGAGGALQVGQPLLEPPVRPLHHGEPVLRRSSSVPGSPSAHRREAITRAADFASRRPRRPDNGAPWGRFSDSGGRAIGRGKRRGPSAAVARRGGAAAVARRAAARRRSGSRRRRRSAPAAPPSSTSAARRAGWPPTARRRCAAPAWWTWSTTTCRR